MFFTFDDIGQVCATFYCDKDTLAGAPCKLNRARTIALCKEDEPIFGKVLSIRNSVANVAVSGFVTFPFSGTTPTVGYTSLCGDGTGGVCVCADGKSYWVVSIDPAEKTVTILL